MSVIKPSTQNDRYLVSTNKTKNNYNYKIWILAYFSQAIFLKSAIQI